MEPRVGLLVAGPRVAHGAGGQGNTLPRNALAARRRTNRVDLVQVLVEASIVLRVAGGLEPYLRRQWIHLVGRPAAPAGPGLPQRRPSEALPAGRKYQPDTRAAKTRRGGAAGGPRPTNIDVCQLGVN